MLAMILLLRIRVVRTALANVVSRWKSHRFVAAVDLARRPFTDGLAISLHPIDGFSDLFYRKEHRLYVANVFSGLYFLSVLFKARYTGFLFAEQSQQSLLSIFSRSVILLFIAALVNWSICTLLNGNGTIRKIWIVTNYSLIPLITANVLTLILSNYFTLNESVFLSYVMVIGSIYTMFLVFKGLEAIHEYTFRKSILSVAYTVVGILLLGVLVLLLFSLIQQIVAFAVTVTKELDLR
jgi:hypothetical protein